MAGEPGGVIIGRARIKVLPDTSDFHKDLVRWIKTEQARISNTAIEVPVEFAVDKTSLAKQLTQARLLATGANIKPVDITSMFEGIADIEKLSGVAKETTKSTGLLGSAMELLGGKMGKAALVAGVLAAAFKGIKTVAGPLGNASGFSGITLALEDLGGVIGPIDQLPRKLLKIILPAGLLKIAFLELSKNALGIVGSFGNIIKLSALLPGALATAAAGAFVFKAAMGDASEKLKETGKGWTELKEQLSDNFWEKAQKPISDMSDKLRAQMAPAAKQAATDMGELAASLANTVSGTVGSRASIFFESLSKSMKTLSPGLNSLAAGFTNLAVAGAEQMPKVSAYLNSLGTEFGDWMTQISKDGTLEQWTERGISALKGLKDSAQGAYDIISSLVTAAESAGAPGLEELGAGLKGLGEQVNSEEFQDGLRRAFEAGNEGFNNFVENSKASWDKFVKSIPTSLEEVLPRVGSLGGDIFGTVLDTLSDPEVGAGVVSFLDSMQRSWDSLKPYIPSMQDAAGALVALAGAIGENQAKIAGPFLGTLSDTFLAISPVMKDLSDDMSSAAQAAVNFGSELVANNIDNIKAGFEGLVQPLRDSTLGAEEFYAALGAIMFDNSDVKEPLSELVEKFNEVKENGNAFQSTLVGIKLATAGFAEEWRDQWNNNIKPSLSVLNENLQALWVRIKGLAAELGITSAEAADFMAVGKSLAAFLGGTLRYAILAVSGAIDIMSFTIGTVIGLIRELKEGWQWLTDTLSKIPGIGGGISGHEDQVSTAYGVGMGGDYRTFNYNVNTPQGTMTENEFQRANRRVASVGGYGAF